MKNSKKYIGWITIITGIFIGLFAEEFPEQCLLLFTLVSSILIIIVDYKKEKRLTTPLIFFVFLYLIGYIGRYLYLIYFENNIGLSKEQIIISLLLSFIGLILFVGGYLFGGNVKINKGISCTLNNKQSTIILLFNGAVTFMTLLFLILQSKGITNYLDSLANRTIAFSGMNWAFYGLSFMSIASLIVYSFNNKYSKKIFYKIYFLMGLVILALSGSRIILIMIILSFILLREYIVKKKILFFKGLLLFFLIVILYLLYFLIFRVYLPANSLDYFYENKYKLLLNTLMNGGTAYLDGLAVVSFYMPDSVDYLYGTSILGLISLFIPRVLFPNKPPLGSETYNVLFNAEQYSSGTGQNPSLMGEFYMNFGIIGLIVGMFIFGFVWGILNIWKQKGVVSKSILPILIYTISFPSILLYVRDGLGTGTFLRILIPMIFNFLLIIILNKSLVIKSYR